MHWDVTGNVLSFRSVGSSEEEAARGQAAGKGDTQGTATTPPPARLSPTPGPACGKSGTPRGEVAACWAVGRLPRAEPRVGC